MVSDDEDDESVPAKKSVLSKGSKGYPTGGSHALPTCAPLGIGHAQVLPRPSGQEHADNASTSAAAGGMQVSGCYDSRIALRDYVHAKQMEELTQRVDTLQLYGGNTTS